MKRHKQILLIFSFVFCFFLSSLTAHASVYFPEPPEYDKEAYPYYALVGTVKNGDIYDYTHYISKEPIKVNYVKKTTGIRVEVRGKSISYYQSSGSNWASDSYAYGNINTNYTIYDGALVDEYGVYNGNHDITNVGGDVLFRVPPVDLVGIVRLLGAKVMVNLPIIVGGTICLVALLICLRVLATRLRALAKAS